MNEKNKKMLTQLKLPQELKTLSISQMEDLAQEIRDYLIEIGDRCGGHLASNLGVVELTIVLHSLLDSPRDKITWDTSHQTYVHKMLTDRLDRMFTIKQDGGLSGFAKIKESPHDAFGAGHASTALSAALGIAQGRDLKKENYTVVAVAGDSAFSGGMCFEALNNIENLNPNSNFICILNDNNMSISPPVGNMSTYITKIRTSKLYDEATKQFEQFMSKIPKVGEPLLHRIERASDYLRELILDTKKGVIFEEFGFKYIGPIDGHNISMLMAALKYAKSFKGPIMIHIITQKGKGHASAEADPEKYHGVKPIVKPITKPLNQTLSEQKTPSKLPSYTEVFGKSVIDICNKRNDVMVITPAMEGGSGLVNFHKIHPDKFIDVGIAEEHAVTFCAGLVQAGIKPILAIYSTFLQRGYDQLVHDVCLQELPMVFALDRAGLVGEDGPTHHGVLDYNYMLPIPNLTILAPKDGVELDAMMKWAVNENKIVSIRYPRGDVHPNNGNKNTPISPMKSEVLFNSSSDEQNNDIVLLAAGSMAWPAFDAAEKLHQKGYSIAAINLRTIKPLDINTIAPFIKGTKKVVVIEEGQAIGGIFYYIINQFQHLDTPLSNWHQIAIPDKFITHGKQETLRNQFNLSANGIYDYVCQTIKLPYSIKTT